jgi:hypothetical protein
MQRLPCVLVMIKHKQGQQNVVMGVWVCDAGKINRGCQEVSSKQWELSVSVISWGTQGVRHTVCPCV